jgi:hypothetical protein
MAKTIVVYLLCLTALSVPAFAETIVPTSEKNGQSWRYTFEKPSDAWFESDFDDSAWAVGPGGFGTKQTPNVVVGTTWNTSDIWLRRTFTLAELPANPVLRIHYDEDPSVYINGQLIAKLSGWSTYYESQDMGVDAIKSLKAGRNVLAVHSHQTYGGQFIDVGIESIDRWSREQAWNWQKKHRWLCGFNYIPANAISYTEMWMGYSFDPKRIDAELALAEDVGFNCLRVVLPYVVWEAEPKVFKDRLSRFLAISDKRRIKVMFTLFDDCVFGPISDPVFGKQPEMVEGWYANGWTPSPGHSMVRDRTKWPKLRAYVGDIIDAFKDDPRVFCWDLYNEPTNGGLGNISIPLVEKVFLWARQVNPSQPLTVAIWNGNGKLNDMIVRHSDIVTFHSYGNAEALEAIIKNVNRNNRPAICTEWAHSFQDAMVWEKGADQASVGACTGGWSTARRRPTFRGAIAPATPNRKSGSTIYTVETSHPTIPKRSEYSKSIHERPNSQRINPLNRCDATALDSADEAILKCHDVFGEVFDLFFCEVGGFAVAVVFVEFCEDFLDCHRPAVVEIRSGPPYFDEGRRVEADKVLSVRTRSYVVLVHVGIYGRRMTVCTAGFCEEPSAVLCGRAQIFGDKIRAADRLKRF